MEDIAVSWKDKTMDLAGKYLAAIQSLRAEHKAMQMTSFEAID